jgi:hypothetical protein
MSNSALEAGIPVLTEIIEVPHIEFESASESESEFEPEPVSPWSADQAATPPLDAASEVDVDGWLSEEWNHLEQKIGGRILHQVMSRLESDIEQRVRDALAEALQVAVTDLAANIKHNLQDKLQEAISQAVKEEVSRMQTAKN